MQEMPCDVFAFSFRVKFHDFHNNYPMCVTTETDALQCHGLGPAYGPHQGCLAVYIYTVSGKGPHGRGIQGNVDSQGWVKSEPLTLHTWHEVMVRKTERELSIEVDGIVSSCSISEELTAEEFVMRTPGALIVANSRDREHVLHGELEDFQLHADYVLK